jgi:proteasome component ECM29
MALLYDKSPKDMQDSLVKSLLNTFNVGRRRVREDTQVVVDSESGEFSTYKDLCQVATEMGQPDLVYKFLDLASHHSIWNSKMGAAFSLGSIASTGDRLKPHLKKLIPKLYRYQHDPNPKIKETMRTIWQTLVLSPAEAVTEHFDAIMEDLMTCISGRMWRDRASSASAVNELIQMRKFVQVEPYLETLWVSAFRTLDDINDIVRTAGTAATIVKPFFCTNLKIEMHVRAMIRWGLGTATDKSMRAAHRRPLHAERGRDPGLESDS